MVKGVEFRACGLGIGVEGLGVRVQGLRCRVVQQAQPTPELLAAKPSKSQPKRSSAEPLNPAP